MSEVNRSTFHGLKFIFFTHIYKNTVIAPSTPHIPDVFYETILNLLVAVSRSLVTNTGISKCNH